MDLSHAYDAVLADMGRTFPLVLVLLTGLVVVVLDAFRNNHPSIPWLAALAMGFGLIWETMGLHVAPGTAYHEMIRTGGLASFINVIVLSGGLMTVILSMPYLKKIGHNYGEVYAILLFATGAMMVLGTANNLITVFVGLETMSICLYILTGLVRENPGSVESALKYFLLGAFSTGFFLYGIALIYGATGTMYLPAMREGFAAHGNEIMFWAGVSLLFVGFLFKVSAVPFHMWTPDVYQGAPTVITGYMSTASKAAAFSSLILVLYYALPAERWSLVLAVIAVITMAAGNVLALAQPNVKRMLAYSSIAHAGYILTGVASGLNEGYSGALFYLLVYTLMNIGAFGVLALLEWDGMGGEEQTLDSLSGIGYRKPLLGVTMAIFMFSLAGFPGLGGFIGKYAVFAPAIHAGLTWLAIAGFMTSAVAAFYYLRVLYVFWMKPAEDQPQAVRDASFDVPLRSAVVLVVCAALLVVLGVMPQLLGLTDSYFDVHGFAALLP